MGKPNSISVEDLMRYLNINDWKHFQRLIKNNKLPQVSQNRLISRKDADKITLELRGKRVDWYSVKQLGRDTNTGGPLRLKHFSNISKDLEDWYLQLSTHNSRDSYTQLPILGIICLGGFLRGHNSSNDTPFILPLQSGINVLIGDRGSGKSTALNMLTLLSDSTTERANVLIKTVLELLQGKQNLRSSWKRRIWYTLRTYGVDTYICFFRKEKEVYAFYINTIREGYELLHREQHDWLPASEDIDSLFPKMQILHQGDVFRIADDDEQLVLNNILDSLYPNLYEERKKLAHQLVNIANQYHGMKNKIKRLKVDRRRIDSFLDFYPQRFKEIQAVAHTSTKSIIETLNEIESYIQDYERVDIFLTEGSLYELLQSGKDAMFCLYVGRISRVLREKIAKVRHLLQNNISTQGNVSTIHQRQKLTFWQGQALINRNNKEDNKFGLVYQTLNEILFFLKKRIPSVRQIWKYFHNLPVWNNEISELCKQYISFLENQSKLIKKQEIYCKKISDILKQENLDIHLFTYKAGIILDRNKEIIKELNKADEHFTFLFNADIYVSRSELFEHYKPYKNTLTNMFKYLETIGDSDTSIEANKDFVFHPIRVELRQGNVYRSFEQLSFGQKSGIILMIAIWMTKADIIVIDQPEDNLDSQSIIYMLTPTILRVSKNRSVIIATHNSNLVMGLGRENLNLFVLESYEEFGRLLVFGSLRNEIIVRKMIDVLEGGIETFEDKWKLYDEFITLFPSDIQDIDIALIESSYRRRIIDNLRNYLQPVVSDRFILTSLRHELKNLDQNRQTWLQQNIDSTKYEIEQYHKTSIGLEAIILKLDLLLSSLDKHLDRVTDAIEQIRRMDTQPHPTEFELYLLISEEINSLSHHDINFDLREQLKNFKVYADQNHTRLIFNNLFKNAVRATQRKAAEYLMEDFEEEYTQTIIIDILETNPLSIAIQISDNGIGIPPDIQDKLYNERCSTQLGEEHGYGGIIIRKLLDLNGGSIQVTNTRYRDQNSGTVQKILLPIRSKI
ncbi:ATP-binding protein [Spirulina sp. 06S082]|uniref:ATP-binding protein n=1 Tax=Spirulina sp. 06S082 TaxID=3110248 RepID=UPI002B1FDA2C|nr:ATP-binding protein [Spirulina sp. 06S082]MEA5468291.1 ATP-binding protein [Spirulina sp. 06S082]